jgi:dihydrofolate reductase
LPASTVLAEFPEMIPGHFREPLGLNADNQHFDTILMGRTTYDIGRKVGLTSPYPHLRQIVVSKSIAAPDPAVEVVGQDVIGRVRALKAEQGKEIWLAGGGGSPRFWSTRSMN